MNKRWKIKFSTLIRSKDEHGACSWNTKLGPFAAHYECRFILYSCYKQTLWRAVILKQSTQTTRYVFVSVRDLTNQTVWYSVPGFSSPFSLSCSWFRSVLTGGGGAVVLLLLLRGMKELIKWFEDHFAGSRSRDNHRWTMTRTTTGEEWEQVDWFVWVSSDKVEHTDQNLFLEINIQEEIFKWFHGPCWLEAICWMCYYYLDRN